MALLVAVPVGLEGRDPQSRIFERCQHSRGAWVQVRGLEESRDPGDAQGDVGGAVSNPGAAHVDDKGLGRRVGTGGALGAGVGLAGRHADAVEGVSAFPESGGVELSGLAQIVGLGQRGVCTGSEGLRGRSRGAGPDAGLRRPAGKGGTPVGEGQRDSGPLQLPELGLLVVVAPEEPGQLSGATDGRVDRAGPLAACLRASVRLDANHLLPRVGQALSELAEEARLRGLGVLGVGGERRGERQRQERSERSLSCVIHRKPLQ